MKDFILFPPEYGRVRLEDRDIPVKDCYHLSTKGKDTLWLTEMQNNYLCDMDWFLESCCTSVEEVLEAQARGAGRIELCERLDVGGVTPSDELLAEVLAVTELPVNVLVRPRGGDFIFSEDEVSQMLESITACRERNVNGVVIGALDSDGGVDIPTMKRLLEAAKGPSEEDFPPLSVTFHRAFDVCSGPLRALDEIISLGCDRLLTSGHEADAFRGRFLIAELVRRAEGRITVMAGCGVRPGNIDEIRSTTGAPEYHASSSFFRQQ